MLKVGDSGVSEHTTLAEAAFDHFTIILGSTKEFVFSVSLDGLYPDHFDLECLDEPISEDEIWTAIKAMPTSKH